MNTKFGCHKIGLVLHLAQNPGDEPRAVANAVDTLGMSLKAMNTRGNEQVTFTRKALEDAIAKHARARYGTTTERLEKPGGKLHGPHSWVRIRTGILAEGSSRPSDERFAPVVTIFWAFEQNAPPGRKDFDRFVKVLTQSLPVRAGAAGLVWAGIEHPMMKNAAAVAEEMLAQMLACPHAHSNHRAALDTTNAALEPGFWMFLGPGHLERLGKSKVSAAFQTDFGASGASFALFDDAPVEATRAIVEAHARLARSLGPLYPPAALSEIANGVSLPKAAGFRLSEWLARYQDGTLMKRVTADLAD